MSENIDDEYLVDYAVMHGFTVGEVIDYGDEIKDSVGFAFYRARRAIGDLITELIFALSD